MSSTFFGLNIGCSCLNADSASINTTANNVSNANTPGYSKQVVNLVAKASLRNYTYGTLGSGVDADSISQMRNTYYDVKYWANNSNVGQYEKKQYYMSQIENLYRDDETKLAGFDTIYTNMFNALDSLKGSAADQYIRTDFINKAQSFMDYFNNMYKNLQTIQADCNQEVVALVTQINSYAQKISIINDKINTIEIQGRRANELRDQRAYLIDQLSSIVPVEIEETEVRNSNDPDTYLGGTNFRIRVEGQLLVDGNQYNGLECYAREQKVNQNDIDGLYDIRWSHTKNEFVASSDTMSGELKAVLNIRDGNNKENFQGTLSRFDMANSEIRIVDPNIKSVEGMNMPNEGLITVANRTYSYTNFRMEVSRDKDGNAQYEYVFKLSDKNGDLASLSGKSGREVSVGRAVDARGLPYYMSQMNEFLRSFCRKFNDFQIYGRGDGTGLMKDDAGNWVPAVSDRYTREPDRYTVDPVTGAIIEKEVEYSKGGVDVNGNQMGAFFVSTKTDGTENKFLDTKKLDGEKDADGKVVPVTYYSDAIGGNYYQMTAGNIKFNDKSIHDSNYLATSSFTDTHESEAGLVDDMLELQSRTVIYRGSGGDQFLKYIISDISVDANEAEILYANYSDINTIVDTYRMSISSVDEDEEGMDLIKFQNAYNLASKIISTMNEMYDRLITQTGV